MFETWKDVEGYEGLYKVSNLGNVKSFRQSTKFGKQKEYILKPSYNQSGYQIVTLYRNARDKHKSLVHRLVAETFLENPNQYPCVNHKNEIKDDNRVDNLEWCTYEYNNAYGTARIRGLQKKENPVSQYTMDGLWLATYSTVESASRLLGFSDTSIRDCCKGKHPYSHGYVWKYTQLDTSLLQ